MLSLGALLQAGWNDRENLSRWLIYARFDPDENDAPGSDQYLDGVPMEEMDFPALGFSLAIAPLGFDPYTLSVTLPQDIVYYREVNGLKVPALTLLERFGNIVLHNRSYHYSIRIWLFNVSYL